jgi:hypothetical protein
LGKVLVEAAPSGAAADTKAERPKLTSLLKPKEQLSKLSAPTPKLASAPWFWWVALGWPCAIIAMRGGLGSLTALRRRAHERRSSATRQLAKALAEARRLTESGDDKGACSAIEKALMLDIEAKTGLKARGILRRELADELVAAGCDEECSKEVAAILTGVDELRFGQSDATLKDLVSRTSSVTKRLHPKKKGA